MSGKKPTAGNDKSTTLPLMGNKTAWSGSGGGISAYEVRPVYQYTNTNSMRGIPDVAYIADPSTGFPVYCSTRYFGQTGWFLVGGTSAGTPQWAALIALANELRGPGDSLSSNNLASSPEYNASGSPSLYVANYRDITSGTNGSCGICRAMPSYDLVTGLGSPLANALVPFLGK